MAKVEMDISEYKSVYIFQKEYINHGIRFK